MPMPALPLAALAALLVGALVAALCGRRTRRAGTLAAGATGFAALLGLPPALGVLLGGPELAWSAAWSVPWGSLTLRLDPLSAFFFAFVLLLAVPFAVYGRGYMEHGAPSGWRSLSWSFYLLLVFCMALLVLAADGLLFLVAWEGMSVASLLLVLQDHEKEEVRRDGLAYAVATHLGAAALLALFALWGSRSASLRFADLAAAELSPGAYWAVFLLALAGFGSKAGLVPFHVWLPRAHPSAPSHVSALMSGVMIKMGIYGLLRMLLLAGAPRASSGAILLAAGGLSCVGGVVLAVAQHDGLAGGLEIVGRHGDFRGRLAQRVPAERRVAARGRPELLEGHPRAGPVRDQRAVRAAAGERHGAAQHL